jgi:hypothetical protein
MPDMPFKHLVEEINTGRKAMTMPTISMLLSDGDSDTSIVFDGRSGSATLNCFADGAKQFKIVGPDPAVADLQKCGAGKGADCCKFLVAGVNGVECARFGTMHYDLVFRTMNAKREPTKFYPACQTEPLKTY